MRARLASLAHPSQSQSPRLEAGAARVLENMRRGEHVLLSSAKDTEILIRVNKTYINLTFDR